MQRITARRLLLIAGSNQQPQQPSASQTQQLATVHLHQQQQQTSQRFSRLDSHSVLRHHYQLIIKRHGSFSRNPALGQSGSLTFDDVESVRQFIQLLDRPQRKLLQKELVRAAHIAKDTEPSTPHGASNQTDAESEQLNIVYSFGQPVVVAPDTVADDSHNPHRHELHINADDESDSISAQITFRQYNQIFFHQALPFIGFGFLDNFIMIVAGDYIDATLGVTFGISTMAAAGLGNAISDVAGIGSAWYIENICSKIGISYPRMSPEQEASGKVRFTIQSSRAIGIVIGCLLGMFPLLLHDGKSSANAEKKGVDMETAISENANQINI